MNDAKVTTTATNNSKDANELKTTATNPDLNGANDAKVSTNSTTNNLKDADKMKTTAKNPDLIDVNDLDKVTNDVLGSFQVSSQTTTANSL